MRGFSLSFLWFCDRTSAAITHQPTCYHGKSLHVERSLGIRAHSVTLGQNTALCKIRKSPKLCQMPQERCCGASPKGTAQCHSCNKSSGTIYCTTGSRAPPWAHLVKCPIAFLFLKKKQIRIQHLVKGYHRLSHQFITTITAPTKRLGHPRTPHEHHLESRRACSKLFLS